MPKPETTPAMQTPATAAVPATPAARADAAQPPVPATPATPAAKPASAPAEGGVTRIDAPRSSVLVLRASMEATSQVAEQLHAETGLLVFLLAPGASLDVLTADELTAAGLLRVDQLSALSDEQLAAAGLTRAR